MREPDRTDAELLPDGRRLSWYQWGSSGRPTRAVAHRRDDQRPALVRPRRARTNLVCPFSGPRGQRRLRGLPMSGRPPENADRLCHVEEIDWPAEWQIEAREVMKPYVGADVRLRIIVGPPTSVDGSVMEGFVALDGRVPTCIFERSERPDLFSWRVLPGPVLRIEELQPRGKSSLLYAHPEWTPR